MRFQCNTIIAKRHHSDYASTKCFSTVSLFKSNEVSDVVLYVFTQKNKSGTKYLIKNNIGKVHSRFIDDGKLTITLLRPALDIIISNAASPTLAKFLNALKIGYKGGDINELQLSPYSRDSLKINSLEKPKQLMRILQPSQYPHSSKFPDTLTRLSVNNCNLSAVDSRILKLKRLVALNLANNQLSSLPSLERLSSLKDVCLSNNKFQLIPAALLSGDMVRRLGSLDISGNKLLFVDNKLCHMESLVTLNLSRNNIRKLPSNLHKMRNLQHLNVSDNVIVALPYTILQLRLASLSLYPNSCFFDPETAAVDKQRSLRPCSIPSLQEICARFLHDSRKSFKVEFLPAHLQEYLESSVACPCKRSCFESKLYFTKTLDVDTVVRKIKVVTVDTTSGRVKLEGCCCSKTCFDYYYGTT